MSDSWDERRRAQEEGYFDQMNKKALARLADKKGLPVRKSPITAKPMEQIAIMGVVVDRCVDSGGLWLDAGELNIILQVAKDSTVSLKDFIKAAPTLSPTTSLSTEGLRSPVADTLMNEEKILGITVCKCPVSSGIWLDARELEQLIKSSHQSLLSGIKDFFALALGK